MKLSIIWVLTQDISVNINILYATWINVTHPLIYFFSVTATPHKSNEVETTECYQGRGEGYRGTVDVLPTGLTCQRWDSQYPHNHTFIPQAYPCK